jgi:antitoxin component YwqK of YwqJK toxin-antitoxin module
MHEDASKADEVTNAKQAFASLQQFFEVEPLRSGIDFIEARWWDARGDHSLNVPTREFEISELLSCVEVNLNLFPPVSLKEPVLGPSETLGQETISLMHYICGANKRNQCFLATHDAGTQAEISVLFERHGLAVGSFHNQEQFEARCMKLMDGFTTTWFPNGQKELEMRYEGSDLVDAIGWQPDGECSETNLSDGNGVYVRYFPQGGKSWERNYQGKSLHGKSIRWRSDGSMQWDHEYKEGLADGIWVEWYPDGNKKSERNYLFGKLSGPASEWHENGTKSVDTDYLDDKRHGAFARWHANGKPKWKGLFVEGQRDGEWTSWDDDGVKWYDELYERGELIERNL